MTLLRGKVCVCNDRTKDMMAHVIVLLLIIAGSLCPRATYAEDPYRVLEVPAGCSIEEAIAAWRIKSFAAHPDMGGSTAAQQRLNDAMDKIKRGIKAPPVRLLKGPSGPQPWRLWRFFSRLSRVRKLANPIEAALLAVSIGATHEQGVKAKILDGLDYESRMTPWQKWQMAEFARSHGYPTDTSDQRRQLADSWEVQLASVYNVTNWDSILLGMDSNYNMRFEEVYDGSQFKDFKFRRHSTPSEFLENEGINSFYSNDFMCRDREVFGPGFITSPKITGREENWLRVSKASPWDEHLRNAYLEEREQALRQAQEALDLQRQQALRRQQARKHWWEVDKTL